MAATLVKAVPRDFPREFVRYRKAMAGDRQGVRVGAAEKEEMKRRLVAAYMDIRERQLSLSTLDLSLGKAHQVDYGRLVDDRWDQADSARLRALRPHRFNSLLLLSLYAFVTWDRLLIYGPPGFGKTTLAELLGGTIFDIPIGWIQAGTIYGNPFLTPEKMLARYHYGKLLGPKGEEEVLSRLFCALPVHIVDEINRLTPRQLADLFQVMDRGLYVYGDQHVSFRAGPIIATANKKDSGTSVIPPPALDRFGVSVVVTGLDPTSMYRLAARPAGNRTFGKRENVTVSDIEEDPKIAQEEATLREIQTEITQIPIDPDAVLRVEFFLAQLRFCAQISKQTSAPYAKDKTRLQFAGHDKLSDLCLTYRSTNECPNEGSRICNQTENLMSVRAKQTIIRLAQFLTWWHDLYAKIEGIRVEETGVNADAIAAALPYVLQHRLEPTPFAREKYGVGAEQAFSGDMDGWIREMWEKSRETFEAEETRATLKDYVQLVYSLSEPDDSSLQYLVPSGMPRLGRETLDDKAASVLKRLAKIDDVARYGFIAHLLDLAGRTRRG